MLAVIELIAGVRVDIGTGSSASFFSCFEQHYAAETALYQRYRCRKPANAAADYCYFFFLQFIMNPKRRKGPNGPKGPISSMEDLDRIISPKPQPNFYAKVYAIVEQIPLGKVTTYGAIAEEIGMKGSSRMVGQALGALSEGSGIPAQRVINRIGALSGAHHFGGYERMRSMLRREGVTFKKELVDMEKHFWDPKNSENNEIG
jgi:methylated-DNA-protein-cysteine methyltransferase related protein